MTRADSDDDQRSHQTLQKLLRGAFGGPPTHLKDIPTREGKSRKATRGKQRKPRAA